MTVTVRQTHKWPSSSITYCALHFLYSDVTGTSENNTNDTRITKRCTATIADTEDRLKWRALPPQPPAIKEHS